MSTKSLAWGMFGPWHRRDRTTATVAGRVTARISSRAGRPAAAARMDKRLYLGAGLAAAAIVLLLAYVFSINQSAAKGYEITQQKNKLDALIEDNKKLLVRTAEVGSIVQ